MKYPALGSCSKPKLQIREHFFWYLPALMDKPREIAVGTGRAAVAFSATKVYTKKIAAGKFTVYYLSKLRTLQKHLQRILACRCGADFVTVVWGKLPWNHSVYII